VPTLFRVNVPFMRINMPDNVKRHQRMSAQYSGPRAGSGVVRIDPLRFLAGCRTRRL